ncbi:uncharacterized protein BXZ73DRAFT_49150 [Epithele typhae]|uniref:uncharacterized protein n=1 Tax=Epithele typhae TaxID=378194 RepID=UPI0020089562|nr:uncharacterized protein BXZ73DRAFT_49150 [Epithele typhae]KAH9927137.1 hypothetical protein BXZ73DRAFT_49150 [Epithele typhae]
MSYVGYDTYQQPQFGYPMSHSVSHAGPIYGAHPSEFGYEPGYAGTAYTDPGYVAGGVYPSATVYPQRAMSQYGPRAYDDFDLRDSYHSGYATPHGGSRRRRSNSLTRSMSRMSRRNSTYDLRAAGGAGGLSGAVIKFKRKGGFRSGITLGEAMSDAHLSSNDNYSLYDLNADSRGRIILKLRWSGYSSMTYELPADCYDGRVELQTLARRIARACVHFLQARLRWMGEAAADDVAALVASAYSTLKFHPPPGQFTVLAAFVLHARDADDGLKVISLGTGSKCLPGDKLPRTGDALHDCHAEVLARRGAVRWLLEEAARAAPAEHASRWLHRPGGAPAKFALRERVELVLYVSTVPCGDASTRALAAAQDPAMAALKDAAPPPAPPPGTAARGRDGYAALGVLRTKPGRADAPPTRAMACSDKLAAWGVLGVQGALAARALVPVYVARVVVGEVASGAEKEEEAMVREDCERALFGRLRGKLGDLPHPYRLREPAIEFTAVPFVHSRSALSPTPSSGCNDSLCWVADSPRPSEVLINGLRRGVPPKHRHNPKFRPSLSKLALYRLFRDVALATGTPTVEADWTSYEGCKRRDPDYERARQALKGPGGPFEGWVLSGKAHEQFDIDGAPAAPPPLDQDVA